MINLSSNKSIKYYISGFFRDKLFSAFMAGNKIFSWKSEGAAPPKLPYTTLILIGPVNTKIIKGIRDKEANNAPKSVTVLIKS